MVCSIAHDILVTRAPFMVICTMSLVVQVKSPHIPNGSGGMVHNIEDVLILSLEPLVSTLRYTFGALWSLWWDDHQATGHQPLEGHTLKSQKHNINWHSYIHLCSALDVCSPLTGNTTDLNIIEEYTWQTVCKMWNMTWHTHRLAKGMTDFLESQDGEQLHVVGVRTKGEWDMC